MDSKNSNTYNKVNNITHEYIFTQGHDFINKTWPNYTYKQKKENIEDYIEMYYIFSKITGSYDN